MSKAHYIFVDKKGIARVSGNKAVAMAECGLTYIEAVAKFEELTKVKGKVYGVIGHTYKEFYPDGTLLKAIPKEDVTDTREPLGTFPK